MKFASTRRLGAPLIVGLASLLLSQSASAQTAGFQGSYVGVSLDDALNSNGFSGFMEGGSLNPQILEGVLRQGLLIPEGKASTTSAPTNQQFQGRLDLENSALSIRGTMYVNNNASAVLPTLTYDLPVSGNTNVYAGAGYALVRSQEGGATPLGDRSGLVLSTGAETEVLPGLVVYGDAKLGVNTDSVRGNSPMRLQIGVGRRF